MLNIVVAGEHMHSYVTLEMRLLKNPFLEAMKRNRKLSDGWQKVRRPAPVRVFGKL